MPASLLYGVILIFGGSAIPILLYDLYMMLTGRIKDNELIQIKESEEDVEFEEYDTKKNPEAADPDRAARKD